MVPSIGAQRDAVECGPPELSDEMKDPIQERMDALTAANVGLLRRVEALEKRVRELEGSSPQHVEHRAGAGPQEQPPFEAVQPESRMEPPADSPLPSEPPAAESFSPPPAVTYQISDAPQAHESSFESRVGLNWVNRIGAVTLILGVAFFFKYAVDNEWIGPAGRIALGVLAGVVLCAFGYRSWMGRQTVFAQGVTAAGVAVLYLSFWASHSLYGLVPGALAFALMVAATAMGGGFAWLYESFAMAAISYLAGTATPFLLATGEYRPWVLTLYLAALNAVWLTVARREGWRKLEWLAAAAVTMAFLAVAGILRPDDVGPVVAAFAGLQYAIFAGSPERKLTGIMQVAAMVVVGAAWEQDIANGLLSLIALLIAGLALGAWRKISWLPAAGLAGYAVGYLLLRAGAPTPLPLALLLGGATAGFALTLGTVLRSWPAQERPGLTELGMLVAPGALYFFAGYELLSHGHEAWRGLFTAGLAALYLGVAWRLHGVAARQDDYDPRGVLFGAGAALTLATVAAAVQFEGFRITMIWALEAAALAWLAAKYGEPRLRWAVLALTALVAARLVALDGPAYLERLDLALLSNSRFLTHAVAAISLGAAAWWLKPKWEALVPYLAAHVSLLIGLSWENYTWVLRSSPAEEQASAISIGLTILGAVYGLALVISGVLWRFPLNRLLGLGLLAIVVAKLYLADVWSMERLHRILAFGALGVLLLTTSFFYSRFRSKIEDWIKNDESPTRAD